MMMSTEVNNIFQAVASSDPDLKRAVLTQGLSEIKIDQMDCAEMLKMYP